VLIAVAQDQGIGALEEDTAAAGGEDAGLVDLRRSGQLAVGNGAGDQGGAERARPAGVARDAEEASVGRPVEVNLRETAGIDFPLRLRGEEDQVAVGGDPAGPDARRVVRGIGTRGNLGGDAAVPEEEAVGGDVVEVGAVAGGRRPPASDRWPARRRW
jgi:hypothetical protein